MIALDFEISAKFTIFRISVFNALIIDYSAIALRTLGHFPTQTNHHSFDYLSYFLAAFTLTCFILELSYMFILVNSPKFYTDSYKSEKQTKLREVYFEGILEKKIKESWFARNYNFFYLARFMIICFLIFNFQYLQALQVFLSLIVMILFCVATIYYEFRDQFFKSGFLKIFRLIQEVSMTLIVFLINLFYYDSVKSQFSNSTKLILVMIFVVLLILNICLEIIGCIINMVEFIRKSCSKDSSKTQILQKRELSTKIDIMSNSNEEKNMKKRRTPCLVINGRVPIMDRSEREVRIKSTLRGKFERGTVLKNSRFFPLRGMKKKRNMRKNISTFPKKLKF
jgi:hypothetical protein